MTRAGDPNQHLVDPAMLPRLPEVEGVPADHVVLRFVAWAHSELQRVYEGLRQSRQDELRVLVRLLDLDWRRRVGDILPALDKALAKAKARAKSEVGVEPCPGPEQVAEIVGSLKEKPASEFLPAMLHVVEHCCVGSRLVPWTAKSVEVDRLYKRLVEAEDGHLAQLMWLNDLLGQN